MSVVKISLVEALLSVGA